MKLVTTQKFKAELVKLKFDYDEQTGRLTKKGKLVGSTCLPRSTSLCRRTIQTSQLVWCWHHGHFATEDLLRRNGDYSDDRIENLALRSELRRPVLTKLPGEIDTKNMLGDLEGILNTGIYEILNINNGHRYIGSAVDVSKRWREHLRQLTESKHHGKYLQRSWNKHGKECFVFKVLLCCSKENLIRYEQALIDFYRPEYNSAPKAGSQLGFKMSDESRKKMSDSRPRDFSPMKGKHHTDEAKARISASKTGAKLGTYTPERIAKCAQAMRDSIGALTEDQVRTIRAMNISGYKHQAIADLIGCSYWAVADIARNRTYKWLI